MTTVLSCGGAGLQWPQERVLGDRRLGCGPAKNLPAALTRQGAAFAQRQGIVQRHCDPRSLSLPAKRHSAACGSSVPAAAPDGQARAQSTPHSARRTDRRCGNQNRPQLAVEGLAG
jgi:hypothetical protein